MKDIIIGYPTQRNKSVRILFPDGEVSIKVWDNGDTIVDVAANGNRYEDGEAYISKVVNRVGTTVPLPSGHQPFMRTSLGIKITGKRK